VTVAAAGNWLLGCDRIGPQVLKRAAGRWTDDVELVEIGSTSLALLDHVRAQDLLVVVDACVGRGRPGHVVVTEADLGATAGPSTSVHQIGPLETLAVARELDPSRMPRHIVLVLVETEGLDPEAEVGACRAVIEELDRVIGTRRRAGDEESTVLPSADADGRV
jgi:hydrogenase maturation protease